MGSCCCCGESGVRQQQRGRPQQAGAQRPPLNTEVPGRCEYCSIVLDACLLEGHRETCRTNIRRRMRENTNESPAASQPSELTRESSSIPQELRCIICYDQVKAYAFVPCGHLICCLECSKTQSECPVCRTPRAGLLHVPGVGDDNAVLCLCKHCGHVIEPSVFDGHREVCSLRMRQLRQEEKKTDESTHLLGHEHGTVGHCVQCKKVSRSTAFMPCGHRLLCQACSEPYRSSDHMACPVCFTTVKSVLNLFES